MQAVVDNLLTRYHKSGKGPLVLLLHGWGDSSDTFKQLTKNLESNYTVIAVDLPGFGQTQIPPTVWRLDNYADFVKQFLAKIDAGKPHAIIAHSNGGAVAIRGLAQHTLQADKLVLLASAGIRDRQRVRRFILKIIAKVGKVATFWLPFRYQQALRKRLYGVAGSDLLAVPHLQETFKITVRQDVQKDAKKLELPTLLIYGDNDRATPPFYGEIYAGIISKSTLRILPDATHYVHQDQPDEVGKLIREFLK